jgi:hypothetical protein
MQRGVLQYYCMWHMLLVEGEKASGAAAGKPIVEQQQKP